MVKNNHLLRFLLLSLRAMFLRNKTEKSILYKDNIGDGAGYLLCLILCHKSNPTGRRRVDFTNHLHTTWITIFDNTPFSFHLSLGKQNFFKGDYFGRVSFTFNIKDGFKSFLSFSDVSAECNSMNGPPVIVDCCNIEVTEVFLQSKYNFLVYSLRRSRSECEFNCFGDESCFLKIEK